MTDSSPEKTTRLHAVVEGHVQGVGFRYFVLNRANELDVKGWVRNTFSGDVEVVAEGERPVLDDLLESLQKGPRSSFVSRVRENWEPATDEFTRFDVKRTF